MNEIHSPHFGIFHLFIFSKLGFLCRNCNYAKVHIFMLYLFIYLIWELTVFVFLFDYLLILLCWALNSCCIYFFFQFLFVYLDWRQAAKIGGFASYCHCFKLIAHCFQQLLILCKLAQIVLKMRAGRLISMFYSNPALNCIMLSACMRFLWCRGRSRLCLAPPSLLIFMPTWVISHFLATRLITSLIGMYTPGIR